MLLHSGDCTATVGFQRFQIPKLDFIASRSGIHVFVRLSVLCCRSDIFVLLIIKTYAMINYSDQVSSQTTGIKPCFPKFGACHARQFTLLAPEAGNTVTLMHFCSTRDYWGVNAEKLLRLQIGITYIQYTSEGYFSQNEVLNCLLGLKYSSASKKLHRTLIHFSHREYIKKFTQVFVCIRLLLKIQ